MNSDCIRVSVIIPVYDQAVSLAIVLRFFDYQDYPQDCYEVIVVDDGSPSKISNLIDTSAYGFSLLLLRQQNLGRASARNRGVSKAQGELIVFSDADRIPHHSFISQHAHFHKYNRQAATFGCPWDCFYTKRRLQQAGRDDMVTLQKFSRLPAYYVKVRTLFSPTESRSPLAWTGFLTGNASMRCETFHRVGGFDERFKTWGCEHFDLGYRLQKNRIRIFHTPSAANYHIPHKRKPGFYRYNIEKSVAVLVDKYPDTNIVYLKNFLLGELSLQAFERRYSQGAPSAHL